MFYTVKYIALSGQLYSPAGFYIKDNLLLMFNLKRIKYETVEFNGYFSPRFAYMRIL